MTEGNSRPRANGGRPARMPREERRAQLLDAAQQMFVTHGYHGTAMDQIAESAQVSKPVLYQHFPSKRELFLALLDGQLNALTSMLLTAMDSTTDNRLRVQAVMRTFFTFVGGQDRGHRLIFDSGLSNDPDVAARLEELNSTFAEAIARVIAADTRLPLDQAELLGRGLAGLAQTSARHWAADPGDIDLETASDLVYRLAWRGISRFPKES